MTALRVVKALKLKCERCDYESLVSAPPKRCPKCKSPYWNIPRGKLRRGRPPVGTRGKARR